MIHLKSVMVETVDIRGHQFEIVGTAPHVRLDGKSTTLHVWRTTCAHHGCTTAWCIKTPAQNRAGELVAATDPSRHYSPYFDRQFCLAHRPQRTTKPTTYDSRKLLTDDEVVEMRAFAASFQGAMQDLYRVASLVYGVTAGTAREIIKGRKRPVTTIA